jgi:hypothetical protein
VKEMLEMLEGMVKTFVNNLVAMNTLEVLLVTLWLSITGYASWYFISAKHNVPLTGEEVGLLWKIHKVKAQCDSKKCVEIRRRGKIVGFKCECGYKHVQKRRMV